MVGVDQEHRLVPSIHVSKHCVFFNGIRIPKTVWFPFGCPLGNPQSLFGVTFPFIVLSGLWKLALANTFRFEQPRSSLKACTAPSYKWHNYNLQNPYLKMPLKKGGGVATGDLLQDSCGADQVELQVVGRRLGV